MNVSSCFLPAKKRFLSLPFWQFSYLENSYCKPRVSPCLRFPDARCSAAEESYTEIAGSKMFAQEIP